jgi:predicted DNA-binding transcriptional regulator AlpA
MGLISEGMVADKLGVSRQAVQQLRLKGRMPVPVEIQAGTRKRYAYDESKIDQYIEQGLIGSLARGRPVKMEEPTRFILMLERSMRDELKNVTPPGMVSEVIRGLIAAHLNAINGRGEDDQDDQG